MKKLILILQVTFCGNICRAHLEMFSLLFCLILPMLIQGQLAQNILVATGGEKWKDWDLTVMSNNTEVIADTLTTSCPNLPENYPLAVHDAIGMRHNSKIVICGGCCPIPSECYSFTNGKWKLEAFKLDPPRRGATSVEIRPGEWLIMGGLYENPSTGRHELLSESKLLRKGHFRRGPDLPEPSNKGSAVMVNETHLFLVIGSRSKKMPGNYLLNINTEKWTRIADKESHPYRLHMTGIFRNSTAGEIQVANIGYYVIEVYSPRKNSWHLIPFPAPLTRLTGSSVIQQGTESFLLIGGKTNLGLVSGDVYLFNENGFSILKENVLQVPRNDHVAMSISKNDFACN